MVRVHIETLHKIEQWFVVLALVLLSGAMLPLIRLLRHTQFDIAAGDTATQLIFVTIYLVVAGICLAAHVPIGKWLLKDPLLVLLIGLALLSIYWSEAPRISLRRSVGLAGATLFGVYFSARFAPAHQIRLLLRMLVIIVVASFVVIILAPSIGLDRVTNAQVSLRGVFSQKNVLARTIGIGLALLLSYRVSPTYRPTPAYIGLVAATLLLTVGARSVTLIGSVALLLLTVVIVRSVSIRWPFPLKAPILLLMGVFVLVMVVLVLRYYEPLLILVGKDITLNGRIPLWRSLAILGSERPWLGYGYNGFWLGEAGPSQAILNAYSWNPTHGHNGFVDVWLDLGYVGLTLFALNFLIAYRRAWHKARHSASDPIAYWPLLYLSYFMIVNLTQSTILTSNSLFWALYVAVVLNLAADRKRRPVTNLQRRSELVSGRNDQPLPSLHT